MDKKDILKGIQALFEGYGMKNDHPTLQMELATWIVEFGDDRFIEGFDSAIKHAEDIPEEIGGIEDEDDENFLI